MDNLKENTRYLEAIAEFSSTDDDEKLQSFIQSEIRKEQRKALVAGIKWTIENYLQIIIDENYGKVVRLGKLADEAEKYYDSLVK